MDEGKQNLAAQIKCNYCRKKVVECTSCVNCASNYHSSCAARVEVSDKSGKFKCCKTGEKSKAISQKSGKHSEKSGNFLEMDENKIKSVIKDSLQQFLAPFLAPLERKIDMKFEEMERSMNFMSASFEDQKTKFEVIFKEYKALKIDNEALKQQINKLEIRLDEMELKERENNLIIVGVPKQPDYSAQQIAIKVIKAIKADVTPVNIVDSFRLKKEGDGPILVKLTDRYTRNEVLKSIKKQKGVNLAKCGLQGGDRKIYLNEDLPVTKRNLFKKVREFKADKGYKAAFCINGMIYLKKSDNDPPVKIKSEVDMHK